MANAAGFLGINNPNQTQPNQSSKQSLQYQPSGEQAVYWLGQDGNIYYGNGQGGGIQNLGSSATLGARSFDALNGARQIEDPNRGNGGFDVLDANTSRNPGGYDPMAGARNNFTNNLNTAIGGITGGANASFQLANNSMHDSAQDMYDSTLQGQRKINTDRENNALNYMNNVQDIRDYVRYGMQGANTQLANMGAMNSSAAGELARVYSELGQGKMRKAGNEEALKGREIDTAQTNLDMAKAASLRKIENERDNKILTIGEDVKAKLMALDAEGAKLGLAGKVQVEALKQQVIDQGKALLGQTQSWLQNQLGGIKAQDAQTTQNNARQLQMAGQSAGTTLGLGESAGMQTGAPMGLDNLPIYLQPKKDDKR